tara:strand:+ start:901 stop:2481 length:1581 start_codon:yes stop_codon:yes gene_type:complete
MIKSDNGGPFVALRATLKRNGIELKNGLPGNPRAQGQVERANATLKIGAARTILDNLTKIAKKYGEDDVRIDIARNNWVQPMLERVENMNNTPKQGTRMTPMEMHFPGQRYGKDGKQHARFFLSQEDQRVITLEDDDEELLQNLDADKIERLVNEYVTRIHSSHAQKYLKRAARKNAHKKVDCIRIGDTVLVRPSLLKKTKKSMSEPYFPYRAKVISTHQRGTEFKIRWESPCPDLEKPGEMARKNYRRDQLLVLKDDDDVAAALIRQNYLRANSRSAGVDRYEVEEVLKEVLREDERGVEVLVVWKGYANPTWESLSLLHETDAYKLFSKENSFIREEEQRNFQEAELESGDFTFQRILDVNGDRCLVLWKYFDEPTWEDSKTVKHVENFKEIVKACRSSKKIRNYNNLEEDEHSTACEEASDKDKQRNILEGDRRKPSEKSRSVMSPPLPGQVSEKARKLMSIRTNTILEQNSGRPVSSASSTGFRRELQDHSGNQFQDRKRRKVDAEISNCIILCDDSGEDDC